MKKVLAICIFLSITCMHLIGQHSPQSSLYLINPYKYNQAYAGFDRSLSSTLQYRTQWTPITDSPSFVHFNAHLPVFALDGGIGMWIESSSFGVEKNNSIGGSYNMVYPFGSAYLSGGLSLSLNQKIIDGSKIITPDGEYGGGEIIHNDPILFTNKRTSIFPGWSLNILYKNESLQAGLQFGNIVGFNAQYDEFTYETNRVFSLTAAYKYGISDELYLQPSSLIMSNGSLTQINIGVLLEYGNIFGGFNLRGFTPNSLESLGILSGVKFGNFYTLAYSYDLGISQLRNSSEGSHEIIFNYNLNKLINTGLPPKIIHNPRDL